MEEYKYWDPPKWPHYRTASASRVDLDDSDRGRALANATLRISESERRGLKDAHGRKSSGNPIRDRNESLADNVLGSASELAVCKFMGWNWAATVNVDGTDTPDVGTNGQVRSTYRWKSRIRLIVRPEDSLKQDFYLVTGDPKLLDYMEIWGFINGGDARRPEWWGNPCIDRDDPCWEVPPEALFEIK